MLTITSADGTPIACWRSGSGSPLLLVHGATASHATTWRFVLGTFEGHYTVYAMDRRGRGGSGDAAGYTLQREAEDVAAVVDFIGEPVNVVGHSYGGLCALEGARLTRNIRRLVLYEGVPLRGATRYDARIVDRLQAHLQAGDLDGMLVTAFREVAGLSVEEVELLRAEQDAWAIRRANAHTLPRELREDERYRFAPERFREMQTPTLLLVGGDSLKREEDDARGVAAGLPQAHVEFMPGVGHTAMYVAPANFVRAVVNFLDG